MAQTGFTPISLYYTATAATTPTAGNLVAGELALNNNDGKLFYKDSSGVVQTIATKASAALGGSTTGSGATVLQTSPTITTPVIDKITTSVANTSLGAGNASIMKNRIINGAMVISQYNGTSSVSIDNTKNQYYIDRWAIQNNTGSAVFSYQQVTTAPTGFNNSLKITVTTADGSLSSTAKSQIYQPIEGFNFADLGWGTANAKTITISFWVQSSVTGTFGGALNNESQNRSYPFTYTINSANTWEYKTITIAGDTTGTWTGATNGIGVYVNFSLGAGTSRSGTAGAWNSNWNTSATGATNLLATNGATFYITGVQLEVGSSATGFEYRQYTTELQLAQRYYYRITSQGANTDYGNGFCDNTTAFNLLTIFPTTMRTAPTALEQNGTASDYKTRTQNTTSTTCSAVPSFSIANTTNARTNFTVASGLTAGQGGLATSNTSNGYLGWSAEL